MHKMGQRKASPEQKVLRLYWILACLRLFLTLLPQRGYIHPDEYFQSIEVIAGDVFDLDVSQPWEFNVTFPIRSILLPKLVIGIPYITLNLISSIFDWSFGVTLLSAYSILVVPRIVACVLSFVTDYCLYKICLIHRQKYHVRLMVLGSSYVMLIYGTRTFSNSVEMALFSFLVYIIAETMAFTEKVIHKQTLIDTKWEESKSAAERAKLFKIRAALPDYMCRHGFIIATTLVAGVFNRPTFLAFSLVPIFFWLQRGLGSRYVGFGAFHQRIFLLVIYALPTVFLFILVDSFYYGYLTWDEIGMREVTLLHFVATPFNFFLYNSQSNNLAEHGLHPFITHILVNIPILYNVLGVVALAACGGFFYRASKAQWSQLPRVQSITMLMTGSFIAPVALLSLIPHQEARFLIPVTLPLIYLHAQEVHDFDTTQAILYHTLPSIKWISGAKPFKLDKRDSSGSLKTAWVVINALLVLFFGFVHQGGVYPLASHLERTLREHHRPNLVHLVTSHMYSLPQSLLLQNKYHFKHHADGAVSRVKERKKFLLTELGSQPIEHVSKVLHDVLTSCPRSQPGQYVRCTVYLALPSSLLSNFTSTLPSNLKFAVEQVFYPHMSVEALPDFYAISETCHKKSQSLSQPNGDNHCHAKEESASSPHALINRLFVLFRQLGLVLVRVHK